MSFIRSMALVPLQKVLDDLVGVWPELHQSLKSDMIRLDRIVTARGPEILLLDFPEVGKLFDRALSTGFFSYEKLPSSMGSFVRRKTLFHSLLLLAMDSNGNMDEEQCPDVVFFIRQVFNLYKKLRVEPKKGTTRDAVKEFYRIEQELRRPSLSWDSPLKLFDEVVTGELKTPWSEYYRYDVNPALLSEDVPVRHNTLWDSLGIFDRICGIILSRYPDIDPSELCPRHGPGAVADMKTGTDKNQFPSWPKRSDLVFPAAYFSKHSEEAYHISIDSVKPSDFEAPARLLAVPKAYKGPRLITAEPTALQFLQQGLRRWLRENLPEPLRHCIDFRSQAPSREAALKSSLDGEKATVDLSSASDRLSLWTVERVFRVNPGLLACLAASRSLFVKNGTGESEENDLAILRKYAGQGNATTFPVQSVVYAVAAIAAVCQLRGWTYPSYHQICRAAKSTRVFGDDIILEAGAVPYLDLILSFLQLKINVSKTHYKGRFRESCGMDAYDGFEVTPLYLSSLLPGNKAADTVSWLDVSNNAWRKGLWTLSDWMVSQFPQRLRTLIPISSGDLPCLSLTTFCQGDPLFGKYRWNDELHRTEGLGLVPITKAKTEERGGDSKLMSYHTGKASFQVSDGFLAHLADPKISSLDITVRTDVNLRKSWVPAQAGNGQSK